MVVPIRIRRGTRANLNALGTANNIAAGEPYLITDEGRFAVGLTANTYSAFLKQGEAATSASPTFTGGVVLSANPAGSTAYRVDSNAGAFYDVYRAGAFKGFFGWHSVTGMSINSVDTMVIAGTNGVKLQAPLGTDRWVLTTTDITASVKLTAAVSSASGASITLPHGVAPTTPVDGDMWTTTAGVFAHVNGVTVGPFGAGGGSASDPLILTNNSDNVSTPTAGTIAVFSAQRSGRGILAWKNDTGRVHRVQPFLGGNRIYYDQVQNNTTMSTFGPSNATTSASGTGAAQSSQAIATTNFLTMQQRIALATGTAVSGIAERRSLVYYLSRRAVGGGFHVMQRIGINTSQTGMRIFCGISTGSGNAASAASGNAEPSAIGGYVGLGKDSTDTALFFMCNGGAANKIALPNTGSLTGLDGSTLMVDIFCAPGDTTFRYRVTRYDTAGVETNDEGTVGTTNLPAINSLFNLRTWVSSTTTSTSSIAFISAYAETD